VDLKTTVFVFLVAGMVVCDAYGKSDPGLELSYGIVYPDGSLATRENPAVLSLLGKDRLSALGALPLSKSEGAPLQLNQHPKASDTPFWFSYGGNPTPFGLGVSVTGSKETQIFAGAGCGTENLQVGYTYHSDPKTQSSTSTYAARFGPVDGHALSLIWGDERKVLGLGFIFGWFVTEIDMESDLGFSKDPKLMGTLGVQTDTFGFNYGYQTESLKNIKEKTNFGGFYYKPGDHVIFNFYYQRFISQFSAGLTVIF
jgi:hypothetical protein